MEGPLLCSWGDQGACAGVERARAGWEGQRLRPDAASRSKGWKQKRQLGTGGKAVPPYSGLNTILLNSRPPRTSERDLIWK